MEEELISVIDVANTVGKRKQTVFKVLRRVGIEPQKLKSPEGHGQLISYIRKAEFEQVKNELQSSNDQDNGDIATAFTDYGVFYLIQLEPEFDPGRIKLGFATNISERLRSHRCSAPFAKVVKTWPCKILWEKTAIESISEGCERLHTEVFRADSLDVVLERCEKFFGLMPNLAEDDQ